MDLEALEARLAALEADLEAEAIPLVPKPRAWTRSKKWKAAHRARILREYEERLQEIWANGTPVSKI